MLKQHIRKLLIPKFYKFSNEQADAIDEGFDCVKMECLKASGSLFDYSFIAFVNLKIIIIYVKDLNNNCLNIMGVIFFIG